MASKIDPWKDALKQFKLAADKINLPKDLFAILTSPKRVIEVSIPANLVYT